MDPIYAKPEYVEMVGSMVYRELSEAFGAEDHKHVMEPGHQFGLLRNMSQPWHKRSEAFQRFWLKAFQAVLTQLSDPSKTWENGIPQANLEGIRKIENDPPPGSPIRKGAGATEPPAP
jgi:hypothetical protein